MAGTSVAYLHLPSEITVRIAAIWGELGDRLHCHLRGRTERSEDNLPKATCGRALANDCAAAREGEAGHAESNLLSPGGGNP
jgi:hypothetical protein